MSAPHFPEKLLQHLRKTAPGRRIGVAVSGGADSVALLRLLHDIAAAAGFALVVLHVDHASRPGSAADAAWVKNLAGSLELPFEGVTLIPPDEAALRGRGFESWARDERQKALIHMARHLELDCICTAHHRRDQIETFFLRLLRGTSIRGLGGIRSQRRLPGDGPQLILWRPLLDVSPRRLLEYLTGLGQSWREDPTNADLRHQRNRVRRRLLPLLEEIRPGSADRLPELMGEMRELYDVLKRKARAFLRRHQGVLVTECERLSPPLRREVLRQWWLQQAHGAEDRLDRRVLALLLDLLLTNACGRRLEIAEKTIVRTARGLEFVPEVSPVPFLPAPQRLLPGQPLKCQAVVSLNPCKCAEMELELSPLGGEAGAAAGHGFWVPATLVADLELRNRRPGDRFAPAGGTGTKKLARWLIDRKIPASLRNALPLIASQDQVLLLPNWAHSRRLTLEPSPDAVFLRLMLRC
jgi:tRNA(Ile)-lysidine synthase